MVRTGDTTQSERAGMRRKAPHIVVTTPESLYILLGSQSGRDMLATCDSSARGLASNRTSRNTVRPATTRIAAATSFNRDEVRRHQGR